LVSYTEKNTYIDINGYLRFKGSNKLVHRWLMEKYLNIKLKPHQIVHHINGNKLDNRTENLRVILEYGADEIHKDIHKRQELKTGNWHGKNNCSDCGTLNDSNFIYCKRCGKVL